MATVTVSLVTESQFSECIRSQSVPIPIPQRYGVLVIGRMTVEH